ncbi:ATP-binding cassette domain-containing protein [Frigidibacter sp. MR17.24]
MVEEFRQRRAPGPRIFPHRGESGFRGTHREARFRALDGAGFALRPGEMLGMVGHNGSGKSALPRLLGWRRAPGGGVTVRAGPGAGPPTATDTTVSATGVPCT